MRQCNAGWVEARWNDKTIQQLRGIPEAVAPKPSSLPVIVIGKQLEVVAAQTGRKTSGFCAAYALVLWYINFVVAKAAMAYSRIPLMSLKSTINA